MENAIACQTLQENQPKDFAFQIARKDRLEREEFVNALVVTKLLKEINVPNAPHLPNMSMVFAYVIMGKDLFMGAVNFYRAIIIKFGIL